MHRLGLGTPLIGIMHRLGSVRHAADRDNAHVRIWHAAGQVRVRHAADRDNAQVSVG